MATTHPHLVKYFLKEEDATKCKYGSSKRIKAKCPDCKTVKTTTPSILSHNGFYCPICSEGMSYPEKFFYTLLSYLNQEFDYQYKLEGRGKKYDFYLPLHNCVVEVHGRQHYEQGFEYVGGRSLLEEQENDRIKREYALSQGIGLYVELDCRESNSSWIRESIEKSPLQEIFELETIDWDYVAQQSEKSLVIEVINYYNETGYHTYKIGDRFKLHPSTILKYLRRGNECGLCNYIPQKGGQNGRQVAMIKDNSIHHIADSAKEMSLFCNYSKSSIASLARGAGIRNSRPGHFINSKSLGLIGFYYTDSQEWEEVKNNFEDLK